jgi:hypothetical protein
MYHAMVEATTRVENSIEDVKELLKKQHPQVGVMSRERDVDVDCRDRAAGRTNGYQSFRSS